MTPRDVFVSHASEDHAIAGQVCDLLEQRGLRCWIAPRDVGAGMEWDEAILDAIEKSRAYLLILSAHANKSSFVKNELNRAFSSGKPIVTLRIEEVLPGRSLELYLARHHWTDAFPPPVEPKVEQLAASLKELLNVATDGAPHDLADALSSPSVHPSYAAIEPARKPNVLTAGGRSAWMAIAGVAVLGMIALAIPALRHLRESPPAEFRTDIVTPVTGQPSDFALSPDGKQIAFVANDDGASRLWVRSFSAATARPLPGTDGATKPFWSPDSRSIGFFAEGGLKRVDLGGGQPQVLTQIRRDGTVWGSWNANGVILFGEGQTDAIRRMADAGGKVTDVIGPGPRLAWVWAPQFLPDGRQFLYEVRVGDAGIYLGSLDGGKPVRLTAESDFVPAVYLLSGWMLWSRAGALTAQRLDLEKRALTGQPQTLADNIDSLSVSATGLVAYRKGVVQRRQLSWVDRLGAVQTVGSPDISLSSPRIAPNGRIAMSRYAQGNQDIWQLDGERTSRLTFDLAQDQFPVWSPDGAKIVFTSGRTGIGDLYWKDSNGAGSDEPLLTASNTPIFATSWSADGRFLLYFGVYPKTGADIWVLPMTGDRKPYPFLSTPSYEVWARFSPDGRWVAYQSSESQRNEIYVRPFSGPGKAGSPTTTAGGQWQVSIDGGIHPMWRPDGKELYFINPAGQMMAVPIEVKGSVVVTGTPIALFQSHAVGGGIDFRQGRQYDVAPDGRFLINTELDPGVTLPITLIQNWNPDASK